MGKRCNYALFTLVLALSSFTLPFALASDANATGKANAEEAQKKDVTKMKKWAYIIMSQSYEPEKHNAVFETENVATYIFTVKNLEEAHKKISELQKEGFGVIELCGAFGEEKAKEITRLTNNKVAIGYVVKTKEHGLLSKKFFSSQP